jgi:transketolase
MLIDFRNALFDRLIQVAGEHTDIVFITADMDAQSLVRYNQEYPERFVNSGVAEQNAVMVAAGLARSGKRVFIYSMVPFVTMRCFEQIKVDICSMNLPVTLVGLGTGLSYDSDGHTAHGVMDVAVMRALPEMTILNPSDPIICAASADIAYRNNSPTYIRLHKGRAAPLYPVGSDFSNGHAILRQGEDLCLVATGLMTHTALAVAAELEKRSIKAAVMDVYRLKPVNEDLLAKDLKAYRKVVTIEEHSIVGGLGSIVSGLVTDYELPIRVKRIALPDKTCFHYSQRDWLLETVFQMDPANLLKRIVEWY